MNNRFSGPIGKEYEDFKLACPHYDEIEELVGKVIAQTYGNKPIKITEIGCGMGHTTHKILQFNPTANIDAVDNEIIMLEQAKISLSDYGQRVQYTLKDALGYLQELKDNSIQILASGFTIHNFNQNYRRSFLEEVSRVLKPEGMFVNADKCAREEPEHTKDLEWQLKKFDVFDGIGRHDLKVEWTNHYIEDNKPEIILKEKEYKSTLKELGFNKIETIFRERMDAVIVAYK